MFIDIVRADGPGRPIPSSVTLTIQTVLKSARSKSQFFRSISMFDIYLPAKGMSRGQSEWQKLGHPNLILFFKVPKMMLTMTRTRMKILGLIIFLVGVGGSAYNWYSVLTRGVYWPKASFLFPFFACIGMSIFLYPMTKAECLEKFGSTNLPWKHIPSVQKILILFGILLGALQVGFFSGYLPF